MPLIVISGIPSSGKSTRAAEMAKYFTEKGKNVILVSENKEIPKTGYRKNEYFADSKKEKMVRADLKSEALRPLNKENVVILDAGNYIKGYRYELYCASKETRTTKCTVYCAITKEQALEFNSKRSRNDEVELGESNSDVPYSQEIFDALCLRFEEPNSNNRWDSPLFTVFPEDQLDLAGVSASLFEMKPPPPNQSTQSAPLSNTNYLFELDQLTQDIVSQVTSARKLGQIGPVQINGKTDLQVTTPADMSPSQLNRLRRQFLNYTKLHMGTAMGQLDQAPVLFVQFLNSNCG